MSIRVGIDLGGTKIELIALDDSGHELSRFRQPTPQGDYQATLATITQMVTSTEQTLGQNASVGIATPGAISPATGLLKNSNSTCLNKQPLQTDLETQLNRPIRLANDADCFTLSEAIDGAAANARSVFGIIIGTGTGGGLVYNKQLLQGPNAITGEWGHNPLPWPNVSETPGPQCYCGKTGCIETYLSGPGLSHAYAEKTQETLSAIQISELASSGDTTAEQILLDYEDRLARSLASVINLLDPDVVVLGGGLSNLSRLITNIPKQLEKYVFSDKVLTRLTQATHGDSSGVRGAAWLWPNS